MGRRERPAGAMAAAPRQRKCLAMARRESDAKATTGGWFWKTTTICARSTACGRCYLETVGRNSTLILNIHNQTGKLPVHICCPAERFGNLLNNVSAPILPSQPGPRKRHPHRRSSPHLRYFKSDRRRQRHLGPSDSGIQSVITLEWD